MISGIWTKKTSRPPDFGTGVIYTFSDVVAPKTQDILPSKQTTMVASPHRIAYYQFSNDS